MAEAFKWTGQEGYRAPDPLEIAKEMFAEMNRKPRLTWNESELAGAKDRGKLEQQRVGEFRPKLPHVTIHKRYHIQNGKILNRAGVEITLDEVPDAVDRYWLAEAVKNYREQAIEADPKLCRHCTRVRTETHEEMIRHLAQVHPEVLQELSGVTGPPPPPAPDAEPKTEGTFKCVCGDRFETAPALIDHAKSHKQATAVGG